MCRNGYCLTYELFRWTPFDPDHDYPDLGARFPRHEDSMPQQSLEGIKDLSWSAVMKRTFEAYIRGERPNMYGEWLQW
jgi:DDB1- and CUL4-associated factor 13